MNEAWCPVPGYENRYRISNLGRLVCVSGGTEREIVLHENHRGYMKATLYDGIRLKTFAIHRLVAMCFLNNPHHYPEVNHINENKHDNL